MEISREKLSSTHGKTLLNQVILSRRGLTTRLLMYKNWQTSRQAYVLEPCHHLFYSLFIAVSRNPRCFFGFPPLHAPLVFGSNCQYHRQSVFFYLERLCVSAGVQQFCHITANNFNIINLFFHWCIYCLWIFKKLFMNIDIYFFLVTTQPIYQTVQI